MLIAVIRWISSFLPLLEQREIIICESCHVSGYVKWPCSRCGHIVGTPIQTASGEWSMQ
jgi:hypothetical protein